MPDISNYDLVAALRAPDCPLCRALARAEEQEVASFWREGRFAPEARSHFFEAGGYCPRHAWMLHRQLAARVGGAPIVDLYGPLARRDLERLERLLVEIGEPRRLRPRRLRFPARRRRCLACVRATEVAGRKAHLFVDALAEAPVRTAYARSDGLCFAHFVSVVDAALARDGELARFLIEDWRARLAALSAQLAEYDRKRDYRFAHEPKGREQRSWTEIVRRYAGRPA